MKIKKKIVIMDIIIVLLVLVNACMIIAIKENSDNINVDSKTYFLMKLYGEDGKAVDYAQKYSLKLEENKKNATQDFKECVAVADYYKAAFYKNVYAVGKDSQKLSQMEQNMEDAQKRMGEMSPIKVKIDRMLEEYMVANN